ncbi:uncharacterized protein METZ01_LOCUS245511, partial [marine metagenome]
PIDINTDYEWRLNGSFAAIPGLPDRLNGEGARQLHGTVNRQIAADDIEDRVGFPF